jgi:hypothetical protein
MPVNNTCSKCGGNLNKGFFYVRSSDQESLFNLVVWVEGEKENIFRFIRSKEGTPQYPVTPYKCESCGHIEFYADPV